MQGIASRNTRVHFYENIVVQTQETIVADPDPNLFVESGPELENWFGPGSEYTFYKVNLEFACKK